MLLTHAQAPQAPMGMTGKSKQQPCNLKDRSFEPSAFLAKISASLCLGKGELTDLKRPCFSPEFLKIQKIRGQWWEFFNSHPAESVQTAFQSRKSLQLVGQKAEFKFWSKLGTQPVLQQSLPKAFPEGDQRFWLQNQWPSSWGCAECALAQLGWVRREEINTGSFTVSCSCWQAVAATGSLEEKCCWLSTKVKKVLMLCTFLAVTRHRQVTDHRFLFFMWNIILKGWAKTFYKII